MRSVVVVLAAVGCGFTPTAPMAVIDTTAGDFSGQIVGGAIAARGAIEPDTYVVGGLHAVGYHGAAVTPTSTYSNLVLGTPTGEMFSAMFADWGGDPVKGHPYGIGLAQADDFTVTYDGEILLPHGPHTLQVDVDDLAFFDVDIDGTTQTIRTTSPMIVGIPIAPTHDGWYPIRGAFSERGGTARCVLAIDGVPFPPTALRARTTDERGLVTFAYYLEELELGPATTLDRGPIDHDMLAPGPSDFGLTTTFSLRYAGQLLIDTADPHVLAVDIGADTDDAFRLWIDGEVVASHWLTIADKPASDPLALHVGWHSIAIDYGNNVGAASVHLRLDGAPVPADHLRPAVQFGRTINVFGSSTPAGWSDGGQTSYDMATKTTGGELIDALDVEYVLTGGRSGLEVTLDQGDAPDALALRAAPNELDFAASQYDYDANRAAFRGQPLGTTWHLRIADTAIDGVGGTAGAVVVASYHGGALAPFSKQVTYTSPPRATPGATTLELLDAVATLDGGTVELWVRTGPDADSVQAKPWVAAQLGAPPPVPADAYFQYQVVLAGDGWQFPSVEVVSLLYE